MCALLAGAAAVLGGTIIPAASAEICSDGSVPEVRFCGADEFCCGKACCPRSMLYFFKLSVAVVLIVMILVWLCNYLRRGNRRRHEVPPPGMSPPSQSPPLRSPQPYPTNGAQAQMQAQMLPPYPTQMAPARPPQLAQMVQQQQQHQQQQPQPPQSGALADDLPPPYHMVVNMAQQPAPPYLPTTHLPSYDASCKAATGPP